MNAAIADFDVAPTARARFENLFARVGPSMGFTSDASAIFVREATLTLFRAGISIVSGTDRNVFLYFLVAGAVRVTCNVPHHALTVEFVKPGRFFGLGSLFDPPGPRCLGAIAHVPSVVAIVTPETVVRAMATLPSCAALQLLAYSWRGLSRLVYRKSQTVGMPLRERLLVELRLLARDFGQPTERGLRIEVPLTSADLATLVGATRAASSRAVTRLHDAGVIEREGGRIVLLDPSIRGVREPAAVSGPASSRRAPDAEQVESELGRKIVFR